MNDTLRTRPVLNATLALALLALAPAARADEIACSVRASGFTIHDASETLQSFCHWDAGRLYFDAPDGTSWELVTSTSDPAIANPGDGQFHVFDKAEVASALAAVRYPLARVGADVFILPYPRRAGLESAAAPGMIELSPGVRPLPAAQQHAEFTHELGHVVQYALMPDADTLAWGRYRRMRGIADVATYNAAASHDDRPHEIFAEDFRAMFGDAQANYSGTIENAALAYPTAVSGLAAYVTSLAGAPAPDSPLTLMPQHGGAGMTFARDGAGSATLDLYDVAGRKIASLAPTADASGCHWSWDGRDAGGQHVSATVVFARARDTRGGVARIVVLH